MTPAYPRTLLFVPGHRESMVEKASDRRADAIVFDLEDSVPPAEKANARNMVRRAIGTWPAGHATGLYVRINPPHFGMLEQDIAVVDGYPQVGLVVPKVDRPVDLASVFARIGTFSRDVIVNIETPRSILRVEQFASTHGVGGLFLGGEDLTEAIGMLRTSSSAELSIPRFLLLAACRAAGIAAYDTICPEFRDLSVVEQDAMAAAALGYDGKFAIHPAQIDPILKAFTPTHEESERARRIVQAYDQAVSDGHGAVEMDGKMVDPPVAERARAIVNRANRL